MATNETVSLISPELTAERSSAPAWYKRKPPTSPEREPAKEMLSSPTEW